MLTVRRMTHMIGGAPFELILMIFGAALYLSDVIKPAKLCSNGFQGFWTYNRSKLGVSFESTTTLNMYCVRATALTL